MDINSLFDRKMIIVFRLPDYSCLQCVTTLNPTLLKELGLDHIDGLVDLQTRRIIPEDMFTYSFELYEEGNYQLPSLDSLFQEGGKTHWETI